MGPPRDRDSEESLVSLEKDQPCAKLLAGKCALLTCFLFVSIFFVCAHSPDLSFHLKTAVSCRDPAFKVSLPSSDVSDQR